jgi:hypothetical protein
MSKCKICNTTLKYSDEYDAEYCPECNIWTEEKCSDNECLYCTDRPDRPIN